MTNSRLYVAKIIDNTIVDGEGFRTSLYLTGCNIFCDGCHNKELWDMNSGQIMSVDEVYKKNHKIFYEYYIHRRRAHAAGSRSDAASI